MHCRTRNSEDSKTTTKGIEGSGLDMGVIQSMVSDTVPGVGMLDYDSRAASASHKSVLGASHWILLNFGCLLCKKGNNKKTPSLLGRCEDGTTKCVMEASA